MMGNGWGMGWMWFIWPLVILGNVLLVVILVRGTTTRTPPRQRGRSPGDGESGRSTAQEILDERYARGGLGDEEYQERLPPHLRGESGR